MKVIWTNPETALPEIGEGVIFKVKVLHNERTHIGTYEEDGFHVKGVPTPEVDKTIWGWHPFTDTGERE